MAREISWLERRPVAYHRPRAFSPVVNLRVGAGALAVTHRLFGYALLRSLGYPGTDAAGDGGRVGERRLAWAEELAAAAKVIVDAHPVTRL